MNIHNIACRYLLFWYFKNWVGRSTVILILNLTPPIYVKFGMEPNTCALPAFYSYFLIFGLVKMWAPSFSSMILLFHHFYTIALFTAPNQFLYRWTLVRWPVHLSQIGPVMKIQTSTRWDIFLRSTGHGLSRGWGRPHRALVLCFY